MGKRKIPARKHHGIRDPLKQAEQRLEKIKDKINNPPEKRDHQKVSYKLAQFMKLRDSIKKGRPVKVKRCIDNEDKPERFNNASNAARPVKKLQPLRQLPNETDEDYLRRINRITQESIKEAEYEKKYGVNVVRNKKTGEISIQKKPKEELDELLSKKSKKNGRIFKKNKIDPKVSKELIKQAIKESKLEEKKQKDGKIVEYKRDTIKFGEIVHAPPTMLTLPRRAEKSDTVARPGKKNNLLLQSLIKETGSIRKPIKTIKSIQKTNNLETGIIDLKGKRKIMPISTRQMLEDQQNKAVELYRQIKKNKIKEF